MKKRSFYKLFAASALFMTVCLISFGSSAYVYAQKAQKDQGEKANEGGRYSREAQAALVESSRRQETNPEDFAAARQPLVEFMAAPPEPSEVFPNPIPLIMYQMLAQIWYADTDADKSVEEAWKINKAGHAVYPDDEMLLLNYAVMTFELEHFGDAAKLFEKFYDNIKPEIKYLYNAGAAFYTDENLKEAKRVFIKMIGAVEIPESKWLQTLIAICMEQENQKEADKYIKLALDFYPMEKRYWNLFAFSFLEKEDYKGAAGSFEIATSVATPEKGNEWRQLIDLYNYIGLPLRSADSIQKGFDLLVKKNKEVDQHLLVADAYVRGARVDKAISYLDDLISKKSSFELLQKKGTILFEARRNKEAIAVFDECVAVNAKAWDAYYMKGWAYWDLKNWKAASKAFDKALNSDEYRLSAQDAIDMIDSLNEAKAK